MSSATTEKICHRYGTWQPGVRHPLRRGTGSLFLIAYRERLSCYLLPAVNRQACSCDCSCLCSCSRGRLRNTSRDCVDSRHEKARIYRALSLSILLCISLDHTQL